MKKVFVLLMGVIFFTIFNNCDSTNDNDTLEDNEIRVGVINKEFILIRDVATLQENTDEISLHVDSILNGFIVAEFISTGYKSFDLIGDDINDVAFEIIDLQEFNQGELPESFDHLAARAIPLNLYFLDNSTYGYADALEKGDLISSEGIWTNETVVLGTFMNAGQFQGAGERYLAFRFYGEQGFQYGWIGIECSQHSDTLKLNNYAYKTNTDPNIIAGQTE